MDHKPESDYTEAKVSDLSFMEEILLDGTWRTAQISFTDDARGYRFLLGFGADCVCIAPENVRKNIAIYLNEIDELYRSEFC